MTDFAVIELNARLAEVERQRNRLQAELAVMAGHLALALAKVTALEARPQQNEVHDAAN